MLSFRKPTIEDMKLFFYWANDPVVREQSYNSVFIDLERHKQWFESALNEEAYFLYIFQNSEGEDIGQVRIQKQKNKEALIGISIVSTQRGKGYAKEMLILATNEFFKSNPDFLINAYIKEDNISSKFAFENARFDFMGIIKYENFKSYHFTKNNS